MGLKPSILEKEINVEYVVKFGKNYNHYLYRMLLKHKKVSILL